MSTFLLQTNDDDMSTGELRAILERAGFKRYAIMELENSTISFESTVRAGEKVYVNVEARS